MKDKTTVGLLALFLGGLGVHRFYLGQTKLGILYLLFCWTYIPLLMGIIDGLLILIRSDEDFNSKYNPNSQYENPDALTPALTVSMNNKTFQVESQPYNRVTRNYEFYNNFKAYFGEYDYISPKEAIRRVERMRESSRKWDNDKYHDLQNRAFSPSNEERLAKIASLEGEELRAYTNSIFDDNSDYLTAIVMQAVFEKLSIHDEPLLLEELETLQPSKIGLWVQEKKRNGYFFTEKVYEAAWHKKNNYKTKNTLT